MRRRLRVLVPLLVLALVMPTQAFGRGESSTSADEAVVTGTLEVAHPDNFESSSPHLYWLATAAGRLQLTFADDGPGHQGGATVRVRGRLNAAAGQLDTGSTAENLEVVAPATVAGGAKNVAVLLINFSNDTRQLTLADHSSVTPAVATGVVFSNSNSVKSFFEEESRGATSVSGQVFGYYTIPATNVTCDWSTWGNQAQAAATAAGVDLSTFTNVVFAWPNVASCGWAGLAYINGRLSYNNDAFGLRVIAHELSHNFGVMHASAMTCTSGGVRVALSSSCTYTEYGDPFTVMGSATTFHNDSHAVGQLSWLASNEGQAAAGGTYTLSPLLGAAAGTLKSLRIARGNGTWLYLDYRTRYGSFDTFTAGSPPVSGVTVRVSPDDVGPTGSPDNSMLVDATPGTTSFLDAPLAVGQSLVDPVSGLTIRTLSVGSTATVSVSATGSPTPTPTPTATPNPTPTPNPSPTPTPTPTPLPTPNPSPTPTPNPTPTPSPSPTPTPGPTPSPSPSPSPTPTPTPSPTPTPPATIRLVKTIGGAALSTSLNSTISIVVPQAGVAAGDTVIVAVEAGTNSGAVGCSDSRGNSYAVRTDLNAVGRQFVCSARLTAALQAGDSIRATYPSFSGLTVATATEFSGLSALDVKRVAGGNSAAPSSGTITTTRTSELLLSVISHNATPAFTSGCGFVLASQVIGGSGSNRKTIDVGYRLAATTGTFTACGTLAPFGQRWRASIIGLY